MRPSFKKTPFVNFELDSDLNSQIQSVENNQINTNVIKVEAYLYNFNVALNVQNDILIA